MSEHDLHDLSGAYAVHALDDVEQRAFEQHLRSCAPCAEEVRGYREAAVALASAAAMTPPTQIRASVLDRIAAGEPQDSNSRGTPLRRRLAAGLTAAAAVALLAVVGASLLPGSDRQAEVAEVQARIEQDGEAAVLVVDGLGAAPEGHVHAVWLLDEEGPTLAGLLESGRLELGDLEGVDEVAVTVEPSATPRAPSGAPVAQVPVT